MLKGVSTSAFQSRVRSTLLSEFPGQTHLLYFVSHCRVVSKHMNGSLLDETKSEDVLIMCSKS